ncbi:hypothetical protein [Mesorhizobium sp. ISC11]|uniref:hypothetical protein n=1 Tax=Mesorhizobium sp. ISC11 TaxID=3076428 RepID=UPI00301D851F
MSNLIHNEQVKLSATFFNSLGVVCFATGVIIPTITVIFSPTKPVFLTYLYAMSFAFLLAAISHGAARWIMGLLKE